MCLFLLLSSHTLRISSCISCCSTAFRVPLSHAQAYLVCSHTQAFQLRSVTSSSSPSHSTQQYFPAVATSNFETADTFLSTSAMSSMYAGVYAAFSHASEHRHFYWDSMQLQVYMQALGKPCCADMRRHFSCLRCTDNVMQAKLQFWTLNRFQVRLSPMGSTAIHRKLSTDIQQCEDWRGFWLASSVVPYVFTQTHISFRRHKLLATQTHISQEKLYIV